VAALLLHGPALLPGQQAGRQDDHEHRRQRCREPSPAPPFPFFHGTAGEQEVAFCRGERAEPGQVLVGE
jgi:hypothetical protein